MGARLGRPVPAAFSAQRRFLGGLPPKLCGQPAIRRRLGVGLGLGLGLSLALGLPQPPARAELAPWVYGEQQRQAPLVVELLILEVSPLPKAEAGIRVRGRVRSVRRQVPGGGVRSGQVLTLRLPPLPARSPMPMVGPSPLRPPTVGALVTAWLEPAADRSALWRPAAGGRSFGPSLEASLDPNQPAPQPAKPAAGKTPMLRP